MIDRPLRSDSKIKSPLIWELYRKGVTARDMSKIFNCHRSTISNFFNRRGISLMKSGEALPYTKHSDDTVERCRTLYDQGLTNKEISLMMKIPVRTVSRWTSYEGRTGISLKS